MVWKIHSLPRERKYVSGLIHPLLELVKVNKHFYLLNSAFHLKIAGNTEKDKRRQKEWGSDFRDENITV